MQPISYADTLEQTTCCVNINADINNVGFLQSLNEIIFTIVSSMRLCRNENQKQTNTELFVLLKLPNAHQNRKQW